MEERAASDGWQELVTLRNPRYRLGEVVLLPHTRERVEGIIREYKTKKKYAEYGLRNSNRLMFMGPAGTGKTMVAEAMANELKLPFFTVKADRANDPGAMENLFSGIDEIPGVYLFTELKGLATLKPLFDNMDRMGTAGVFIAEINAPKFIDVGIRGQFDSVVYFDIPGPDERGRLVAMYIQDEAEASAFENQYTKTYQEKFSQRDIARICERALKTPAKLDGKTLTNKEVERMFLEYTLEMGM